MRMIPTTMPIKASSPTSPARATTATSPTTETTRAINPAVSPAAEAGYGYRDEGEGQRHGDRVFEHHGEERRSDQRRERAPDRTSHRDG